MSAKEEIAAAVEDRVLALGFDGVYASEAGGRYAVVGTKRRHSAGEWIGNGVPVEFDYDESAIIALGENVTSVSASLAEYERLSGFGDLFEVLLDELGRES